MLQLVSDLFLCLCCLDSSSIFKSHALSWTYFNSLTVLFNPCGTWSLWERSCVLEKRSWVVYMRFQGFHSTGRVETLMRFTSRFYAAVISRNMELHENWEILSKCVLLCLCNLYWYKAWAKYRTQVSAHESGFACSSEVFSSQYRYRFGLVEGNSLWQLFLSSISVCSALCSAKVNNARVLNPPSMSSATDSPGMPMN